MRKTFTVAVELPEGYSDTEGWDFKQLAHFERANPAAVSIEEVKPKAAPKPKRKAPEGPTSDPGSEED